MRLGGKRRGYHMANIVTFWYVALYPSIRKRCRFYLDRRFPDRRGMLPRFLDTYRLVRTYGSSLVDTMVLDLFGQGAFTAASPNHDRLRELTAGDRGLVLLHAHVGCWNVGMSTLGEFSKPISVVLIPEARRRPSVDPRIARTIDPRSGLESVLQMSEALLGGEIVVMAGDRTIGDEQNVAPAQFLGGRILLPIAPYRLASATGVPVIVMTAPKIEGSRYELRLAKVIEVPPGLGRNPRNYAPYAQMFADCMEEFVLEFPWQFYNFYDVWDDPNKG